MTEPVRRPLTRMRAAIAKAMTASAAVPQFTVEVDVDLEPMAAARKRAGGEVSYSDALLAAVAATLRAHPGVNASFDGDAIVEHAEINVAVAVAVEDGLIAPAIRRTDERSLAELRAERERLTAAAHAGALTPEDLFSATFTVSNLGPLGVRRFRALVVPPQAAILAVGAAGPDGTMALALSCDHRVLDGAPAARFLGDLRARLEAPEWT